MMIEDLYKTTRQIKFTHRINGIEQSKHRIFKKKQMDKVLVDIEKLKDANREMKYTNGSSQ